jgi:large subunit ribosomal protein L10
MPTPRKEEIVRELTARLRESTVAVATDFRGLTVSQLADVRSTLRKRGIEYRVVKNTLARLASRQAGKEGLGPALEGPVALALGFGAEVEPARALSDYIRSTRSALTIKGALVGSRLLGAEEVMVFVTLPPREVLVARALGGMKAPMAGLVNVLSGTVRSLMYVLQARAAQLEGA